jgi:hypothetical protein
MDLCKIWGFLPSTIHLSRFWLSGYLAIWLSNNGAFPKINDPMSLDVGLMMRTKCARKYRNKIVATIVSAVKVYSYVYFAISTFPSTWDDS